MKLIAILTISLASWFTISAQHQLDQKLFEHAENVPTEVSQDLDDLIDYLIEPTNSKREIATVFAYWIMLNIDYDVDAFANSTYGEETWTTTFVDRKAVCAGYSKLYQEFCRRVGIESYLIRGFSKGFKKTNENPFNATNHGWNIIELDGKYELLDLTWASGYLKKSDGKISFERDMRLSEIFADPEQFVERHLPGQPRWQLLENPITMRAYYSMETFEEMSATEMPYFNFQDSIAAYRELNLYDQMIKDADDAYEFHPIPDELAIWYDIAAYGFSTLPYDERQLIKGKKYYQIAKEIYLSLEMDYTQAAANCEKGIKYIDYRLKSGR